MTKSSLAPGNLGMHLQLRQQSLDLASRVHIMGILNVTPDSFSDGGQFMSEESILAQTEKIVMAGADIIDIGGESTRPFADPVPEKEELGRVIPAIRAIRTQYRIPISIDTTKAAVAQAAFEAGADIINDISALRNDPEMAVVVRETKAPLIIMHMLGTPKDMQIAPVYNNDDPVEEIISFLAERIAWCESQSIPRERIIADPGIGFGKTLAHNLSIIKHLDTFSRLACPILIGHSRKTFLGRILNREVNDRDMATAIVSALCCRPPVAIIRVHDVHANIQAVQLTQAIRAAT